MNSLKRILPCIVVLLLQINVHATISLTSTITDNKCYNGTAGSIVGIASGGSSGQYEYRLATGPAAGWLSTNTFTALAAGTYPLSARDKNNTTDIATIFVTVGQPTNISASSTVTNTSCASSSDGAVALTVNGGKAPYSYTWTKNGTAISGVTTSSITGLTAGVYNAIVTDANGCQQQLTNASSTAIVPLSLTGFNEDAIANGTNSSTITNSTVTSPMDFVNTSGSTITFAGSNLYVAGFQTTSASTPFTNNGLPVSGSLTSAKDNTHQFVFANYNLDNDLYLNGNGASGAVNSGTLTLASGSVAPYQNLYVLAASGNGNSTVGYSVKYTDNSTSVGSFTITDWASGTANIALDTLSRVYYKQTSTTNRGNITYVNAGTKDAQGNIFQLYDLPISLSTNTKNISSITFFDSTSTQSNIFAITGATSSVGVAVVAGAASSVTPTIAISPSTSNLTYCAGESFTFTANPTNGGTSPTYVWSLPTGVTQTASNGSSITATVSGTGSKTIGVTLNVTDPTATCLTSNTASSNIILNSGSVSPTVSVSGVTSICQSVGTTYLATPTNGGNTPIYTWFVNNTVVAGATGASLDTTFSNAGSNSVYAKLTSSVSCAASNPATSTIVATTVNANVTPSATISAKSTKSGANTNVTFSVASSANLGGAPSYQWYLNGNPITNATSSTYTVANPLSTDSYSLAIVSSATCPTTSQIMSNYMSVNTTLPITLDWFKAILQNNNNAMLSWHTTSETNVKIFEVQRSQSSTSSFVTIGAILPTNSTNGSTYSYLDTLNITGNYFYRLKSIDVDGTFTYSDIVSVTINKGLSTSVQVYPNPFSDELHVQISSSQSVQNAGFTLYNIAGQVIYTTVKNINIGSQTIDLQGLNKLPSGMYMLKLNGNGIENNGIKIIKK